MDKVAGQNGGDFGAEMKGSAGFGENNIVVRKTETGVGDLEKMATEMVPGAMKLVNGEPRSGRGDWLGEGDGVVENTRTEMGRMGAKALDGSAGLNFGVSPDAGWGPMEAAQGLAGAERELRRDEQEMVRPTEFVGDETKIQVQERLEADREDFRNEENLPPVGATEAERALINRDHKIVQKVQDAVTMATAAKVKEILKQPAIRPAEVAKIRQDDMLKMLEGAFNYKFGSGN